MPRFREFVEDSGNRGTGAISGTSAPSTTLGRIQSEGGSGVQVSVSDFPASNGIGHQDWRQQVVANLTDSESWTRQQQKPSWDSAHTVELDSVRTVALPWQTRWFWSVQRWLMVVSVGLLSFASYVVIEESVGALSSIRFGHCSSFLLEPQHQCPEGHWKSWGDGFGGFFTSIGVGAVMATTSAWLVTRFAPAASGSGIPEVKTILNGFVLEDVVTFRTLFVKIPCLILAVASGMALGHEGPMVHVAVCWAHIFSRFCPQFQSESKKRELLSAAAAAGISSAFGTPIGGVLFSLEEMSSKFSSRTLLLAFVASAVATLALSLANLSGNENLTLYSVTYSVRIHPGEFVLFALLGILGGLIGAIFNNVNIRWNAFRLQPAFRQSVHPAVEVMFVSILTLTTSWFLPLTRPLMQQAIHAMFDNCKAEPGLEELRRSKLQVEFGLCTSAGTHVEPTAKVLGTLLAAATLRFIQTAVTIGTACPAGLFVPCLFIGSCLGRIVGGAVNSIFPGSLNPGVYAMAGAAAVLGGVNRMTISLVVIMLELTGGLDFIVPFMLTVLFAKAVGDALNEGIYDLYIVLKGYPFLREKLDITFTERCCDVMEAQLTKLDVSLHPSLAGLLEMLRTTSFHGYPVVDGHHLIGYTRRQQLEDLIRCRKQQGCEGPVTLDELKLYIDSTVMRMVPDAPLSQAHRVFQQLGCKHIFIVGSQSPETHDALLGMLSKKRFLSFLRDGSVGHRRDQSGSLGDTVKERPCSPSGLSVLGAAMAASLKGGSADDNGDEKGSPVRVDV